MSTKQGDDEGAPPSSSQNEDSSAVSSSADAGALKRAEKEAAKRLQAEKAAAEAALENSMPSLNAVLKEIEFTKEQRVDWLGHFKTTPLTEAEVVAIVAPKSEKQAEPVKRRQVLRARWAVARHGLTRWLRSRNLVWRAFYVSGWMFLLIASSNKLGWSKLAILSVGAVVVAKMRFVIRDMRPKYMQLVDRGYNERKLLLQSLVETAQRWYQSPPKADQIDQFRRDALTLIAGYVRDHRARFGSREILANLLVADGADVVVVGRSDGLRPVPKRYNREDCALVARALDTGEPQITGDLYSDFPRTVAGKKYCSVLVLPVWFRGVVVGAVSIDSQEKYHFHLDYDDLQVHLAPYVQLLAVTLIDHHDKHDSKALPGG